MISHCAINSLHVTRYLKLRTHKDAYIHTYLLGYEVRIQFSSTASKAAWMLGKATWVEEEEEEEKGPELLSVG